MFLTGLNRLLNAIFVGVALFLFAYVSNEITGMVILLGSFGTFVGLLWLNNDWADIGVTTVVTLLLLIVASSGSEVFSISMLLIVILWSTIFPKVIKIKKGLYREE